MGGRDKLGLGFFMLRHHWQIGIGVAATAVTALAVAALPGSPAGAATGPVSTTPASGTPQLANIGTTQIVRQLAQCGGTMYAVGRFSTIKRFSTTYTRNNIFAFSATSTFQVSSWNPNVNGQVNSIAFSSDCSTAYIGGKFTAVGGTAVNNIAAISTATGAVLTGFRHSANGQVETIARSGSHLLVGGYYKSINNSSANPYMTSLNVSTGADDGFIHLGISGNYHFCNSSGRCTTDNPTRVYNQQISHDGTQDLVEGDFTSVGGQNRQQIFMLNLATSPASLTAWTSPEWDGSQGFTYDYQCWFTESFYIRAASWSPNDSTVYIATTGFHPWNKSTGTTPRSGLCDAAAAFPSTHASVLHTWINYTGCDSLYASAADDGAAYAAGHERWSQNPKGCDFAGPGAIADPGMEGLNPSNGNDLVNSNGNPRYTRSRGQGADDMVVTPAGLWVGSDNGLKTKDGSFFYSQVCNGVSGHAGICFLPY
jgi:hypothetical protein